MKKIMSYILNPIKEDKEGAAKMNTKIRKAIGIVGIIMAVYIILNIYSSMWPHFWWLF